MFTFRVLLLCTFAVLASVAVAATDLTLAGVFNDNMVLQRGTAVPVWGWAPPGANVTVACNGASVSAVGTADGAWSVRLPAMQAGGPYDLKISSGTVSTVVKNVLIGDVWLCSGQSNMAFGLGGCGADDDIKSANFPLIRYTYVWEHFAAAPQRDITGSNHWQVMSPSTAASCSAVAFYFARRIQSETKVPIGILVSSVGGTEIECYMSPAAIEGYPENASAAQAYRDAITAWTNSLHGGKAAPGERPGYLATAQPIGLEVAVPWTTAVRAALAQSKTTVSPLFVALESWMKVADSALRAKTPVPAPPEFDEVGKWLLSCALPTELKRIPLAPHPLTDRHGVGGHGWFRTQSLYNGMMHPLKPFAFKGMLWYQGENGSFPGPDAWFHRMRAMVTDMRTQWKNEFPVYLVQIANWRDAPKTPEVNDLGWAITRMAQLKCLEIPKTGLAVTIDIGDAVDIHPKNKLDVGERLARWALAKDYGKKDLVCSGPLYAGIQLDGRRIRVGFTSVGAGLMVGKKEGTAPVVANPTGKLMQFAIAGEDQQWHWAEAVIDGATVLVSCPEVAKPVAVRYAFAINPQGCNLYNKDGLPASPFRSDTW